MRLFELICFSKIREALFFVLFFAEYIPEDVREKWSSFLAGSLAETNKRNLVELVSQ